MTIESVLEVHRSLDGALDLAPEPGGPFPEIAWGDHFLYYAPDGEVPQREQPYATIVTKDYPDDTACDLDPPERWRLNVRVGRDRLAELIDDEPADWVGDRSEADVLMPHPTYAGWVAVVCPGERTLALALSLLRDAHDDARRRTERRG